MKAKEDIRSISYIKSNIACILEQVNETRRPVYITQNGVAEVVLLDIESYESMKDAINMLKLISMGEKDIKEGKCIPHDEVFEEMDKKFFNKKGQKKQ